MKIVSVFLAFGFFTISYCQNNVCLNIETNPNPNDPALGLFSKYVNVLDCIHIYAVSSITDEKVLHVAAVAAELIDNNEDGIVDDPNIESELNNNITVMPIFHSENSRLNEPAFELKGMTKNRWINLKKNPQDNVIEPFNREGENTYLDLLDNYRDCPVTLKN